MFFALEQSPRKEKVKLSYWQKNPPLDEEGVSTLSHFCQAGTRREGAVSGRRRAFHRQPGPSPLRPPIDSWKLGGSSPAAQRLRGGDAGAPSARGRTQCRRRPRSAPPASGAGRGPSRRGRAKWLGGARDAPRLAR